MQPDAGALASQHGVSLLGNAQAFPIQVTEVLHGGGAGTLEHPRHVAYRAPELRPVPIGDCGVLAHVAIPPTKAVIGVQVFDDEERSAAARMWTALPDERGRYRVATK